MPIMLGHGESAILPALLLVLVLYPLSVWTLVASLRGARGKFLAACGAVIAATGALGCVAVLKDFEWPPDQGLCISFVFWAFPLFAGIVALIIRIRRPKQERP